MSQQVNLGVALGAARTGLPIGYRVNYMNGAGFAAFTSGGVAETTVPGTYVVTTPVTVPDDGAIVTWGTPGNDFLVSIVDRATSGDSVVTPPSGGSGGGIMMPS